jgi:hypothetical protein
MIYLRFQWYLFILYSKPGGKKSQMSQLQKNFRIALGGSGAENRPPPHFADRL